MPTTDKDDIPQGYKPTAHFSKIFIGWLEQLNINGNAKTALQLKLESLLAIRNQLIQANHALRSLAQSDGYQHSLKLLCSIPGIGLTNAMILLIELENITRFKTFDHLCSYAGLKPDIYSSSDTVVIKGLTRRCNALVRTALVESAWKAVTKDLATGQSNID